MTLPSIPTRLYLDLLGKPFAEGARGPSTYDCVGLAMEFQRRRGAVLPAYLSQPEELHRQLATEGILSDANRLPVAEPGCVVLLRTGIHERHLGCMVDCYRFLHTMKDLASGAAIERTLSSQWERLILGYYRVELPA